MNDLIYMLEKSLSEYRKAERLANAIKSPEYALKFENRKQTLADVCSRIVTANHERNTAQ